MVKWEQKHEKKERKNVDYFSLNLRNKEENIKWWKGSLDKWVECPIMVRETWVQSQVVSYQRL